MAKRPSSSGSDKPARPRFNWAWLAYGASLALIVAAQPPIMQGRMTLGIGLTAAGVLLGLAAYLLPSLNFRGWLEALRRPAPAVASAKRGAVASGRATGRSAAAALPLGPRRSPLQVADDLVQRLFPSDQLELSRYWLLAPAVVLVLLSQVALGGGSTVRAVLDFALAGVFIAIYLQDMAQPLVFPRLRRNIASTLRLALGLPFQAVGAFLLHFRYENRSMVWLGFYLCLAASAWMVYVLKRWPLDITHEDAPEPSQRWEAPEPFFSGPRVATLSSLLAAAAISAYLARYVFPAEHPGWSVGFGFFGMALLVGSFPWMPRGLAWHPAIPAKAGAWLSLGAVLLAFFLGKNGQDLIERGNVHGGLWAFLAGGLILVAVLSRFDGPLPHSASPADEKDAAPGPGRHRLEIAAVFLLILVSFGFRIWKIDVFPYGVEGDEGGGGVWSMDTLMGRVEHPLIHQNYPLCFFYPTAMFFKLFGVGLDTLRWHSVIFGTISVASTYLFLRLLMGRWSAWLATLLMSFSYWHLHYSRFGHYNIEQIAMQMVAFYFVFKAMRTGRYLHWAAGGWAFGMAMFPHMAGRLLPFQGMALVFYFFVARRDLLRKNLPGFLAFVLAAWAVAAPAVVYWNRARSVSMGRIQSVSIFDKNNTNAPVDTLGGFVRNCKVSMLMFNQMGDSRHRDNPVAPEKILEHWTAILFALAFIYVLWHWRDPFNFFILAAFFVNMAASIFSVEAPQTLRTAGNIPLVFAIIAVPLSALRASLLRLGNWQGTALFAALLLPAFGWFSYKSEQKLFVQARNLSFDTHPTYIAQVAGREGGPDTQGVFWGTGYASGHPPMVLLTQQTPLRNFYGPFEYLPVVRATERDHLLFLSDDYQKMLPYVQWLYPKAPVTPIPDLLGGGTLAQYVRVNKDVLRSTQGLDGVAVIGGKSVAVKGVDARWPSKGLEGATRMDLRGSVVLEGFGRYQFSATGRGPAQIRVDGQAAFSRGSAPRELVLAKGQHSIAIQWSPADASDHLAVKVQALQPQGVPAGWSVRGRQDYELSLEQLITIPLQGIYGEYFATRLPEGQAAVEVVEPVVFNNWLDAPLAGNWSIRWRARFKADSTGLYRFNMRGGNFNQIKVDRKLVWRQGAYPGGEMQPPAVQPGLQLAAGTWHDFEAIFSSSGPPASQIYWSKPGGGEELFFTPDLLPVGPRGAGAQP